MATRPAKPAVVKENAISNASALRDRRGQGGSSPASAREIGWMGVGLVVLVGALVLVSGSQGLIIRNFWLDEICTWLLVSDPSMSHMFDALLHSVDSNPPAYYLFLRGLGALGVPLYDTALSEVILRVIAGLACCGGLLGLYACLRLQFDKLTSAAATLFLLCSDVLIQQFFQARFYGPWFAISTWFCYALVRSRTGPRRRVFQILLAVLTMLMWTIHYFGAMSFVGIVAVDFLMDKAPLRMRLRSRWPLLCSLPAMAIIGYFYVHQREPFTVSTWVLPPSAQGLAVFLRQTLALEGAAIGVAALAIDSILRRFPWYKKAPVDHAAVRLPGAMAGLIGLSTLPLIVAAFSVLVQPATVSRYALPGIVFGSLVAAWCLSRVRLAAVIAAMASSVVISGFIMHGNAKEWWGASVETETYARYLLEHPPADELILCERRNDLYPCVLYYPELRDRIYGIDFKTGSLPDAVLTPTPNFCYIERDAQRMVAAFYPMYHAMDQASLKPGSRFLFICSDVDMPRISLRFHHATVRQVFYRIFEVTMPA